MAQIKLAEYTFDNSVGDCLPTLTPNTITMTKEDSVNGTITKRIIYIDDTTLPTIISFQNKTSLLTLDYLNFTNTITNASNMFNGCTALISIDTSNWNTSKVSNMSKMFNNCSKLTSLNLSNLNTSNVTQMSDMFQYCKSLTSLDLSNFNTSNVTIMQGMFNGCSLLTSLNISHFDTIKVTNMLGMFQNCSKLTSLNLSSFNTSKVNNMTIMFQNCFSLTSLDLSSFNTSNVTNINGMFGGCSSLTSLDLSNFNTSNVTIMQGMFNGCSKLTFLNLSNFNTSKVNSMFTMFAKCSSLTSLNLSSFNTSNVTNMAYMFQNCFSLTSLDLSNLNTSKVNNTTNMFVNCSSLKDIGLVYCNASTVNTIASLVPKNVECNVCYMDAEPSELTTQTNITYVPYSSQSVLSCSEEITLRSNGDVYDELDLLTGQLIQRIGEDNEILEEEIVRTIELDGEIGFYENSYIHTSSNEITPEFEFQPTLTNCYVVSDLKPNTQYTVLFEGNPTLMSLGGTTIENPTSKIMITSGEVDNILWFDTSVSKIMILEGDLTNRDVEYFTGVKSSQKIEVQLRGNTPLFAKGGRK